MDKDQLHRALNEVVEWFKGQGATDADVAEALAALTPAAPAAPAATTTTGSTNEGAAQ